MDAKQFAEFIQAVKNLVPAQQPEKASQPLLINFENFKQDQESFAQYIERFENYCSIKGLTESSVKKKTFLNIVGSKYYEIDKSINAPKTLEEVSFKDLTESLINYVSPKPGKLICQHRFLSRCQEANETVSQYAAELQKFIADCSFQCECGKSVADLLLCAQFIRGLNKNEIREKLLMEGDAVDFKKLLQTSQSIEASQINAKEVSQSNPVSSGIMKVSRASRSSSRQQSVKTNLNTNYRNKSRNHSSSRFDSQINFKELGIDDLCLRCGKNNHKTSECSVSQSRMKCYACNKKGHVKKVCISSIIKSRRGNNNVSSMSCEDELSDYSDDMSDVSHLRSELSNKSIDSHNIDFSTLQDLNRITVVDLFHTTAEDANTKFEITVLIADKPVKFEVDSGCGYTLLPLSKFKQLKLPHQLSDTGIKFRTYDKGIVVPEGFIQVPVIYNNKETVELLFIVPDGFSALLGRAWIRHLNIDLHKLDQNLEFSKPVIHHVKTIDDYEKMFPNIFKQTVGKIPGVKCSLHLRENAHPVFVKARSVPYAMREAIEKELFTLQKEGIISPVDKSDWGSPIVPVGKPDGSVRLCFDYKVAVNKQLIDAHYPIPRIEELINRLRISKYFCKLDLFKAYLHIEVDEKSSEIQTISTHLGTFRMNRLSFGIKTAPSEFHRILDQVIGNLKGVDSYFDDIIVHGSTLQECEENLINCLQRLEENNLHINKNKCHFFATKIAYLGYVIEHPKISKDPKKVEAILDAPQPTNEIEVKQFLGMVTYYSRFIPNTSTITAPIRKLLTAKSKFRWSSECEAAFVKLKNMIASDQTLIPYDPELPVTVACDASPVGIGAVLSHIINGIEKPIAFVSRSLSQAEMNYSQIDREALAIVFALDKFYTYLYGRKFTLLTDNKPLSRILDANTSLPAMTAARLLRYAVYLSSFNYEVKHRKSEENSNADYLSRQPLKTSNHFGTQTLLDKEMFECNEVTLHYLSTSGITWSDIADHTATDPELQKLLQNLKSNTSSTEFTLEKNIIFRGSCVYIPKCIQPKILEELHLTHPGIVKMKQIARNYCYWPGIDKDIEHMVRSCDECIKNQKSPAKAPLHQWEKPHENFSRVHIDYAGPKNGLHFLVLVDAKSKWPEMRILKQAPSSQSTIKLLEDIFSFHGYPEILVSDNAAIFKSEEFSLYCKERGILQIFSAPGHPATNGLAERYVQILKSKLEKMKLHSVSDQIQQILHIFRATPLSCGQSPAELYFHRKMRIRLDALKPVQPPKSIPAQSTRSTRQFNVNNRVAVKVYKNNKTSWESATIIKKLGKLHYTVRLDNGYVLKRHIDQILSKHDKTEPHVSAAEEGEKENVTYNEFEFVYKDPLITPVLTSVRPPMPAVLSTIRPLSPLVPAPILSPVGSPIPPEPLRSHPIRNKRQPVYLKDYVPK